MTRNPSVIVLLLLSAAPTLARAQSTAPEEQRADPAPTVDLPPLAESLTGESKAEYAAARVLYDDGDYAGALTKLQTAYRTSRDPRLLWNMAAAEKNLRHYSKTISLVQEYLAAGAPYVTLDERAQAQSLIATMSAFVAPVSFEIVPPGSLVTVDGQPLGLAPFTQAPLLDFGKREVQVTLDGYETARHTLELEGGKPTHLKVILVPIVHQGHLRVVTDPNASIRIDGKVVGLGMWQGTVPSGAHTVQFEGEKKQPQTLEVVLTDGEARTVTVQLRDAPSASTSSIPTWVWITGGVAVAALGTGAYFALRSDSGRPAIQEGTWGTLEF